jgi:exosortase
MAETVAVASSGRTARGEISRHAAFTVLILGVMAWFWGPLSTVIGLSLQYSQYEHYSHIVAIPFMTLFLVYLERRTVFARTAWAPRAGGVVIAAALVGALAAGMASVGRETTWTLAIVSAVVACLGGFIVCYGTEAFRNAAYPLLLLLLMAPLPPALLQATITFLQRWSAEGTAVLFDLLGVSVYREGFYFALPGLTIHIAEECSGIRSSLALLIIGLVAGHMFLRRAWSRATLALVIVPLAIVKNAVRIVVLSLLAIHVDPSFITGSATHRYSGLPLFAMSFAILGGIIWVLQKSEARFGNRATGVAGEQRYVA